MSQGHSENAKYVIKLAIGEYQRNDRASDLRFYGAGVVFYSANPNLIAYIAADAPIWHRTGPFSLQNRPRRAIFFADDGGPSAMTGSGCVRRGAERGAASHEADGSPPARMCGPAPVTNGGPDGRRPAAPARGKGKGSRGYSAAAISLTCGATASASAAATFLRPSSVHSSSSSAMLPGSRRRISAMQW